MRFAALDSWRGLCALGVVLFHFKYFCAALVFAPLTYGYLFVDFFFVLSGFVLAHAYGGAIQGFRDVPAFLARRLGRIYPLHVAVLAAIVMVELGRAGSGEGFAAPNGALTFVENLFLVQALDPDGYVSWNQASWSLSVEFWAYVAFALSLVATARAPKGVRPILFAILAILGSAMAFSAAKGAIDFGAEVAFPRGLCGFFAGALASEVYRALAPAARRMPRWAAGALETAMIALVLAFVALAGPNRLSFAAPPVFFAATLTFAMERGALSQALKWAPLRALGEWSYSIYMTHLFLMLPFAVLATRLLKGATEPFGPQITASWPLGAAVTLAYLGLVVAVSSQTHRYIEAPCRRRVNALVERGLPVASAQPAPSAA